MTNDRLIRIFAPLAAGLMLVSTALIFVWVPDDSKQGFSQHIFYIHVPIALTAYACLLGGACFAARHLITRNPEDDLRSYVGVHHGVIWGTLVLITGSLWARREWGQWWDWSSQQLNVFLIIFLYYCAYFMLRFSIDDGPRRATYSSAFTLLGIGMVPLSWAAVHYAQDIIHPQVFSKQGANMEGTMFFTFLLSFAGVLCLALTLMCVELRGKRLAKRVDRLNRAARGEPMLEPVIAAPVTATPA